MRTIKAIALLPLLGVAACAQDQDLGVAINNNVVAQAVSMDPHYAGDPIEGGNGQRSVEGMRRYLSGQVKKPDSSGSKSANGGGSPQ